MLPTMDQQAIDAITSVWLDFKEICNRYDGLPPEKKEGKTSPNSWIKALRRTNPLPISDTVGIIFRHKQEPHSFEGCKRCEQLQPHGSGRCRPEYMKLENIIFVQLGESNVEYDNKGYMMQDWVLNGDTLEWGDTPAIHVGWIHNKNDKRDPKLPDNVKFLVNLYRNMVNPADVDTALRRLADIWDEYGEREATTQSIQKFIETRTNVSTYRVSQGLRDNLESYASVSLMWETKCDLDLHANVEMGGKELVVTWVKRYACLECKTMYPSLERKKCGCDMSMGISLDHDMTDIGPDGTAREELTIGDGARRMFACGTAQITIKVHGYRVPQKRSPFEIDINVGDKYLRGTGFSHNGDHTVIAVGWKNTLVCGSNKAIDPDIWKVKKVAQAHERDVTIFHKEYGDIVVTRSQLFMSKGIKAIVGQSKASGLTIAGVFGTKHQQTIYAMIHCDGKRVMDVMKMPSIPSGKNLPLSIHGSGLIASPGSSANPTIEGELFPIPDGLFCRITNLYGKDLPCLRNGILHPSPKGDRIMRDLAEKHPFRLCEDVDVGFIWKSIWGPFKYKSEDGYEYEYQFPTTTPEIKAQGCSKDFNNIFGRIKNSRIPEKALMAISKFYESIIYLPGSSDYHLRVTQLAAHLSADFNVATEDVSSKQRNEVNECPVCMGNSRNIAIDPCGHLLCSECFGRVNECPICRTNICKGITIYH